jgi:hypothetical protein
LNPQFKCHKADFSVPKLNEFVTISIPFSDFSNSWSAYTGEPTKKCSDDKSVCLTDDDLKKISEVSIWAEGHAGKFHLEVKEITATVNAAAPVTIEEAVLPTVMDFALEDTYNKNVDLVTYDGKDKSTNWGWRDLNDPVMGGLSKSTFTVDKDAGIATFEGNVAIVPSLKAPGFCVAETTDGLGVTARANDAKGNTHLLLEVRSSIAYDGFKVSLAADTLNPQFKSFKANFAAPVSKDFIQVAVPFSEFSNDWSPATGEARTKCSDDASKCITSDEHLSHISQIEVWAEGHEGDFKLEIKSISAGVVAPKTIDDAFFFEDKPAWTSKCSGKVQKNLKYNMSNMEDRLSSLPIMPVEGETLADAICCDPQFAAFAEPNSLFASGDVDLFGSLSKTGENVFYDSVCGIPLFKSPIGRTFEEFKAETTEHGWPSFRDAELIKGNVIVKDDGEVVSKCGTHLGSNLPDKDGNRYCLDLVCISGNMA